MRSQDGVSAPHWLNGAVVRGSCDAVADRCRLPLCPPHHCSKTRGMGAGRKLQIHRRNQRWADKDYKKSHLGSEWKKPFAGAAAGGGPGTVVSGLVLSASLPAQQAPSTAHSAQAGRDHPRRGRTCCCRPRRVPRGVCRLRGHAGVLTPRAWCYVVLYYAAAGASHAKGIVLEKM